MMTRSYERIAGTLLRGMARPKPFCKTINGRLVCGTQSLHRTAKARVWRLFWRLKSSRRLGDAVGFRHV
jgi:hypothetical protein